MRFAWMAFGTLLCVGLGLLPAQADKRVALVIGNGAYRNAPKLPNPRNDAEDVGAALERAGFDTILGLDLDQSGMQDATIRFARAAHDADVVMFYFSGHAMQFAGVNYLMPVDAKLADEADLRRLTRVDEIVADLQQARSLRILVLDSCRDNPLADDLRRSVGLTRAASLQRGLVRIDTPQGMIVSYATQAGRTAADGSGRNSPYTAALLRRIETREEIGTVFRQVSADVYEATSHAQLPELSLSFVGEFYLHGRPQAAGPATPAADEFYWNAIKAANMPALLEEFLQEFPASAHTAEARARLDELKKSQVAVVAPPVQPATPPTPVQPAVVAPPSRPASPCGGSTVSVSSTSRSAQPLSASEECALKPKDVFKECDKCPEMVVVPGGSFTMGSPANEPDRASYEGPQHQVTIGEAFAVGKFTVTFDEWDACVADGGCNDYRPFDEGWGRGRQPVINVSWDDAKAYVAWLSRKTGKAYRLLSEAEREYATRAGAATPFWWGSSITPREANYNANGEYRQKTLPVDSFEPNPWGLYQVHGNVWDWLEDCWHDSYNGAPSNGSAWTTGDCSRRVLRGGSRIADPRSLRAAYRGTNSTDSRYDSIGFRLARTLTP